jgi:hypothetical protein
MGNRILGFFQGMVYWKNHGNPQVFSSLRIHGGYFGSDCATDFGGFVPVISVRTVPRISVRFVPVDFGQESKRFDLCQL